MKTQKSPADTGRSRNTKTTRESSFAKKRIKYKRSFGGGGDGLPPKKRQTKTERAYMLIISRPQGVTENDIWRSCGLSSGRNYTNQLEKAAGITMARISEPNPDGIGSHFRYQICSAPDAMSVINVVNPLRTRRGVKDIDGDEVRELLRPYPAVTET